MQRGINMQLTKEIIEAKKAEYLIQKQQAQTDRDNAQLRLIIFDGAIQDCDYWLTQLETTSE
jgi:hypothetical protein